MAATDVGAGTTITFDGGFFASVESIDWSGISRAEVETTHMGTTGGDTFIPVDTYDPGELSVELQFDEASAPAITSAAENCTVTFPSGNTYQASAFLKNFDVSVRTKDKMMATATLKFSGNITF